MPDPTYTETRTPEIIINTLDDKSKLSQITVGEHELVLVPDDFSQIDNIQVHGVDQPIVDNTVDLSVVEQVSVFPEASEDNLGRTIQFIGTDASHTTGYFYRVISYPTDPELEATPSTDRFLVTSTDVSQFETTVDPQGDMELVLTYDGTDWKNESSQTISLVDYGIVIAGDPIANDTITVDYTASVTGYKWSQIDVQPNPTTYESFFRGKWDDWTDVPSDSSLYPVDYRENTTPTKNDYMVVTDASLYPVSEYNDSFFYNTTGNGYAQVIYHGVTENINIAYGEHYIWNNMVDFYNNYSVCVPKNISGSAMKIGDTIYPNNSNLPRALSTEGGATVYTTTSLVGSWRFRYIGSWTTDGKLGWNPEYQLENVLPDATDTEKGIMKLYNATGQNIDGTMTQKSISDAIDSIQQSFFRGKFGNFTNVPTSASGYEPEPGTQDQTTPTKNDFIVVLDASDYASPDFTEQFTFSWNPNDGRVTWTYNAETTTVGDGTYPVTFGPDNCMYITQGGGLRVNKTSKWSGTILYPNSSPRWLSGSVSYSCATTGSAGLYQGSWRFYYDGTWDVEGKTGWLPQYQVEGVLPVADSSNLGIAKLYDSLGNNTDGAVDQATVTTALDTKQNVLTASTGIEIDENNNISTNNIIWKIWPTE